MKRILLAVCIAAALTLVILNFAKSDEEKILDLVHEAAEGFDRGSVSALVDPLTQDFVAEERGELDTAAEDDVRRRFSRDDVKTIMLALSRRERDAGGFALRARIDEREEVLVFESDDAAVYRAPIEVLRLSEGEMLDIVCELELRLDIERTDGWQIRRARLHLSSGRLGY